MQLFSFLSIFSQANGTHRKRVCDPPLGPNPPVEKHWSQALIHLFSPASPQEICLLAPKTSDFFTASTVMLLILGYVCCFTIPVKTADGDLDSFCVV